MKAKSPDSLSVTEDQLKLAFDRFKKDYPRRVFVDEPLLLDWLSVNSADWINSIGLKLDEGFVPQPAYLQWVPKPDFALRPARLLDPADHFIYTLILSGSTLR